jgi:hypothetical protein
MSKPDSVLVPSCPVVSPKGKDRTEEERTVKDTSTASHLIRGRQLEEPLTSRSETTGEIALRWQRDLAEAHFDAEWERLHAELKDRHRAAFVAERDRLFAAVERARGKTLEGLR